MNNNDNTANINNAPNNNHTNGFMGKFRTQWSYRTINWFALLPIIAYLVKFAVDLVMYIYSVNDQNDRYYDMWYLFVPQVCASVLMSIYYILYFKDIFLGIFFKISSAVMLLMNLVFIGIIAYDMTIGYIYYFALVGLLNFLNGLFLKCNIIPARKVGSAEVAPLIFEITSFVAMVAGFVALIYSFPVLRSLVLEQATYQYYDYINLHLAFKINIASDFILFVCYFWSRLNNSEFIRDNMFDESEFDDE